MQLNQELHVSHYTFSHYQTGYDSILYSQVSVFQDTNQSRIQGSLVLP